MFRRKLDILISMITGLLFLYGVYTGVHTADGTFDFTHFTSLECICMIYGAFYCIGSALYMRKREKGVWIPVLRCSVFLTLTGWCLYGLIFLKGHYGLYPAEMQKALQIFRYGVIGLLMEWAVGEKGHFWKQFTWSGLFVVVVYTITAVTMGALGHGIGLDGHTWPYPFMDVDVLGWSLVIPTCLLVFVELFVHARIWIAVDQVLRRRKKKHGKTV
ncbi:MAG: hypothetical protein ACI32N_02270 [Bulleidia sp.]